MIGHKDCNQGKLPWEQVLNRFLWNEQCSKEVCWMHRLIHNELKPFLKIYSLKCGLLLGHHRLSCPLNFKCFTSVIKFFIFRFCLSETSCPQEDHFPPNLCVKVNGKPCNLPVSPDSWLLRLSCHIFCASHQQLLRIKVTDV